MIDIYPKKPPQFTPPTQIKRQSCPWKFFKPCQLSKILNSCHLLSHSLPHPLSNLILENQTLHSFIPKLPSIHNCLSHFLVATVLFPHLRHEFSWSLSSITGPMRPAFISFENCFYSFSSIIVGLENSGHFLTHRFRHPTTQKGNFSFLFVSFQYFFTSSFSFSSYIFATTNGFFTYHNFILKKKQRNILVWKGTWNMLYI